MKFLTKLRNGLYKMMYGRYGIDELYRFNLALIIILMILYGITGWYPLALIETLLLIFSIFRCFSRNHAQRRKENEFYLKHSAKMRKWFKYQFRKIKNIRKYRYRKCPYCKQALRLPISRGRHEVNCPNCHKDFKTTIIL